MFRSVIYYGNYYHDFFTTLKPEVQAKFNRTLFLIESILWVPERYLKHITGSKGLYEIRVQSGSDIYRVFCFFDRGNLVVLINGFVKKTQKTPKAEIQFAERLMKAYFNEKERKK